MMGGAKVYVVDQLCQRAFENFYTIGTVSFGCTAFGCAWVCWLNARAVILRVRDEGRVKLTVCIDKYTNVSCWFFDCK